METSTLEHAADLIVRTSGRAVRFLVQGLCVLALVAVFAFGAPDGDDNHLDIDAHADGTHQVFEVAAG